MKDRQPGAFPGENEGKGSKKPCCSESQCGDTQCDCRKDGESRVSAEPWTEQTVEAKINE